MQIRVVNKKIDENKYMFCECNWDFISISELIVK